MSQHDFSIANQGFPSFRADLNSGLEALATNSSGATAPTTTYAYQFWYDTANDLLKMRNGDNDAWITLAAFDQANDEWHVRSAVIQAVDAAGVEIKTDEGTTRLDIADDGTVTVPGDLTVTGTLTATLDSSIIQEGNSSVEVVDTGAGNVKFTTDGFERAKIDSSGNFYVGSDVSCNLVDFRSNDFSSSGYQKIAGGLILQWGTGASTTSGIFNSFPISFPNACLQVINGDDGSSAGNVSPFVSTNYSTSGFTAISDSPADSMRWFAIGF